MTRGGVRAGDDTAVRAGAPPPRHEAPTMPHLPMSDGPEEYYAAVARACRWLVEQGWDRHHHSRGELAGTLGIGANRLSEKLSGKHHFEPSFVAKLAAVFGLPPAVVYYYAFLPPDAWEGCEQLDPEQVKAVADLAATYRMARRNLVAVLDSVLKREPDPGINRRALDSPPKDGLGGGAGR